MNKPNFSGTIKYSNITAWVFFSVISLAMMNFNPVFADDVKPPVKTETGSSEVEEPAKAELEDKTTVEQPDGGEPLADTETVVEEVILFAETDPLEDKKVSLNEAIDVALSRNRKVLQEEVNDNIFKIGVSKEITNYFPTISASHNYQYNTVIKTFGGALGGRALNSANNKSQGNTAVSLVQPITDIFRTALRQKIAKQYFHISTLETELQKEIIVDSVASAYFDLLKQKRIIDVNLDNVVRLEEYYQDSRNRFEEGLALSRDYLKVHIELKNAQHQLFIEQNTYDEMKYRFKKLLGINLLKEIDIEEEIPVDDYSDQPLPELATVAFANRPEIKQMNKSIIVSKTDKKLQLSEYIPDIEFFVSYLNQFGSSFQPANNVVLGVNANYNIWEWNEKYLNVKEKRLEVKRKKIELEDLKDQVFIEVKEQVDNVKEAYNLIDVAETNYEYAKESLRITKNRYDEGLSLILDLLDDQNTYLQSELRMVSARLDFQKSLIELQKTLGILVEE
jgi:outer membrane protein TolC